LCANGGGEEECEGENREYGKCGTHRDRFHSELGSRDATCQSDVAK
jgi:hypothetical protein